MSRSRDVRRSGRSGSSCALRARSNSLDGEFGDELLGHGAAVCELLHREPSDEGERDERSLLVADNLGHTRAHLLEALRELLPRLPLAYGVGPELDEHEELLGMMCRLLHPVADRPRSVVGTGGRVKLLLEPRDVFVEDREEQLVLAAEVRIESTDGVARTAGDRINGRRVEPLSSDDLECCPD